jgi:serine protease DegQ
MCPRLRRGMPDGREVAVVVMWCGLRRAAGLLVIGALAAGCGSSSGSGSKGSATGVGAGSGSGAASQGADPFGQIPAIVSKVEPSVVTISTGSGVGSGVIYSADGEIVTVDHVVRGARTVTVTFADGQHTNGTVQAGDEVTDLAVLKVDRGGLPAADFTSATPPVGDLAVVLGSPLGLSNTVTAGIVSATGRNLPPSDETPAGLVGLMQTDAAISPGNSGGAVVNADGQVIGLSEAYLPPSSGAVAIGFATPAGTVVDTVKQLIATGKAKHAYLGVQGTDLTPQVADLLGIKVNGGGVVVIDVVKGSPADKAGLRPSDVITKVDSTAITSSTDLDAALRGHQPGDSVQLTVLRGGKTTTVTAVLGDRPQSVTR